MKKRFFAIPSFSTFGSWCKRVTFDPQPNPSPRRSARVGHFRILWRKQELEENKERDF
jgi:hypothetical protein